MEQAPAILGVAARRGRYQPLAATAWLAAIGVAWWFVVRRQMADLDFEAPLAAAGGVNSSRLLIWIGFTTIVSRFFSLGLEAGFYWAWWRSWGARFRFGHFFLVLASLSLIDAWADTLQSLVRADAPGLARVLAPVLGLALLRDPATPGASAALTALGSLGVLTAVRVVLTARAQAREIGRPIGVPLAVTIGAWSITRLALWWGIDLARGMSPMP